MQSSTILVGHIATNFSGKGPIIVVAYTVDHGKREVAHYTVLHDSGEFELMVPKGEYYLFAYRDKNSNLIYDAGEPAGQYGNPKSVSAPAGGVVGEFNFDIPEKPQPIDIPYGFEISSVKPAKLYSRLAGAKIDLDDALFSEENGRKGYWEPVSFPGRLGAISIFSRTMIPKRFPFSLSTVPQAHPEAGSTLSTTSTGRGFNPGFSIIPAEHASKACPTCCTGNC